MSELQQRLDFMQIRNEDLKILRELKKPVEKSIDRVLGKFYGHVMNHQETASKFTSQEIMDHARSSQRKHWLEFIFSGRFDDEYLERINRVGVAHVKIGLSPQWYMGGYLMALNEMTDIARNAYPMYPSKQLKAIHAVQKAIMLDMEYDHLAIDNNHTLFFQHILLLSSF